MSDDFRGNPTTHDRMKYGFVQVYTLSRKAIINNLIIIIIIIISDGTDLQQS